MPPWKLRAGRCPPTNFPRSSRSESSVACPGTSPGCTPRPKPDMARILAFLLILFATGAAPAAGTDDLLEPEKAFRMSTRAIDARTLEVSFAIADGYYMYRERFKFALEPGSK